MSNRRAPVVFPGISAWASLKRGQAHFVCSPQDPVFPGISAWASLKPNKLGKQGFCFALVFPGISAWASLKLCEGGRIRVGAGAFSQAFPPGPH